MIMTALIYFPKVLIQDYCQAGAGGGGGFPAMSLRLWTLDSPTFNISIHKLVRDPEGRLIRHAADTELSGTAKATDGRLRTHHDDPPQAGVMG